MCWCDVLLLKVLKAAGRSVSVDVLRSFPVVEFVEDNSAIKGNNSLEYSPTCVLISLGEVYVHKRED